MGTNPKLDARGARDVESGQSRGARSAVNSIRGAIRFVGSYWFALLLFTTLCGLAGGFLGSEFGVDNLLRTPSRYQPTDISAFFRTDARFLTAAYITCASVFVIILANFNMREGWAKEMEAKPLLSKISTVLGWMVIPLLLFIVTKFAQRNPTFISDLEDVRWTVFGVLAGLSLSITLIIGWHLTITYVHSKSSLFYFFIFLLSLNYLTAAYVASLAVLTLFGWAALIYFISTTLDRSWRGVLILTSIGLLTLGGLEPYKHRLPGLTEGKANYYAQPIVLPEQSCPTYVSGPDAFLLSPLDTLNAWRGQFSAPPKLVIITASGGGYRAAFWTALVLDKLSEMENLGSSEISILKNVRLLTGASGGMVPLAYFASMMTPMGMPSKSIVDQLREDIAADLDRFLGHTIKVKAIVSPPLNLSNHGVDSLSAITHALVHKDLPGLFWPGATIDDRGLALERQWSTLQASLASLSLGEAKGWRPSLIITPVILERGSPLLISNLELSAITGHDCRLALEFFKLFPESRNSFRLNTAIRMNAAFPVISPTTKLPTKPPMRVADAGYYDNYGTDTVTAFLQDADIQKWVRKNTTGVIIIQIRAYPVSSVTGITKSGCELDPPAASFSPTAAFSRGLEWMTSAIEGLNSTRSAGNLHRAQRQMELLKMIYAPPEDGSDFIAQIIFENRARASLSWHLPAREVDCMRQQLIEAHNQTGFAKLQATLSVGSRQPTLPSAR